MTCPKKIRFELFTRPSAAGVNRYYVRFIDAEGLVICTRTTKADNRKDASAVVSDLLRTLPLERMARAKREGYRAELDEAEKLRETPFPQFVADFWGDGSTYLSDRKEEGRPLAGYYVKNQARYAERFVSSSLSLKKAKLRDMDLVAIERWVREIRATGAGGNLINDALDCIRTPLSWAKKRGLLDDTTFDFRAVRRPKETRRRRGILTIDEVRAIVALPVADPWKPKTGKESLRVDIKPRPRLKGGDINAGPAPIDLRMKAVVLLSLLAGLRRGEIRGLRWGAVDLEGKTLRIESNIVPLDEPKQPKADSFGTIPISDELAEVLKKLSKLAEKIGRRAPDEFVVFGAKPRKPIDPSTVRRGFRRALELIGIEDDAEAAKKEGRPPHPESQQGRRLVLHSGRHLTATRLAETIGSRAAARVTRHRSMAAFEGYASHDSKEALDRARDALNLGE